MSVYMIIAIVVAFPVLLYLIYDRGWGWVRNGYGIMARPKYFFRIGKNSIGHKFYMATWRASKIHRFKNTAKYRFTLDISTKGGYFSFDMLDKNNEVLVHLDEVNKTALIDIEGNYRYKFLIKTEKFSGEYELSWQEA